MPSNYGNLYTTYGQQYGLDPQLLERIARIESGGNPYARTGSYSGLFQIGPAEWSKYGGGANIYDPEANTRAAAAKIAAESAAFRSQYGRDPTPTDIYMVHQQGAGGYGAHMARPDAPAWQNMAGTAEGRQKGENWARAAIWGNIPDKQKAAFGNVDNVTSKDFVDMWRARVEGGEFTPTRTASASPAPSGGPVPSFGSLNPQMSASAAPEGAPSSPDTPMPSMQSPSAAGMARLAFGALSPPRDEPMTAPQLLPVWRPKPYVDPYKYRG